MYALCDLLDPFLFLNPHEDNFLLRQRRNTKKKNGYLFVEKVVISARNRTNLNRTGADLVEKRSATDAVGPASSMSVERVDEIFSNVFLLRFEVTGKYMSELRPCCYCG